MHHLLNCFSKRWPTFSRACLPGLRKKAALKSKIRSDGASPVPDANHRTGGCSFRKAEPSHSKGGGILPSKKTAEYTSSLSTSQLPQSWVLLLLIILTSTCGFTTSISLLWAEGCRERWRRGFLGSQRKTVHKGSEWCAAAVSSCGHHLTDPEHVLWAASTICGAYRRSRPGCWVSFPMKELAELAPVLSWANVPSGTSVAFIYPESLKGTQRAEEMISFVNTEITLFAYVNLKGGPKTWDIWFLKVKSVPSTWTFSFNWDIIKNIENNGRNQLDSFHSWDFDPTWRQTGPWLCLKSPTFVL